MCIRSPCMSLISSFNVSVIIWCCFTRDMPLNSDDSTIISYMAPQPPETSDTWIFFACTTNRTINYISHLAIPWMNNFTFTNFDFNAFSKSFSVYFGLPFAPDHMRDSNYKQKFQNYISPSVVTQSLLTDIFLYWFREISFFILNISNLLNYSIFSHQ